MPEIRVTVFECHWKLSEVLLYADAVSLLARAYCNASSSLVRVSRNHGTDDKPQRYQQTLRLVSQACTPNFHFGRLSNTKKPTLDTLEALA